MNWRYMMYGLLVSILGFILLVNTESLFLIISEIVLILGGIIFYLIAKTKLRDF